MPRLQFRDLVKATRTLRHTYRGESARLRAVRCEFCPSCGEAVLAADQARRVSTWMGEFNRRINAGAADPQ